MANITYSNADNRYRNNNGRSGALTLDRQKLAILQMMQKDPQMATGYLIGSAIGNKYWGDKQAKSRAEADFMVQHPDANKDMFNQYYKAIKSGMSQNDALAQIGLGPNAANGNAGGVKIERDANGNLTSISAGPEETWSARQKALDEYINNNGQVLYSGTQPGTAPKSPIQQGQTPITMDNVASMGGMTSPEQAYQKMAAAPFNEGNTPMAKADYNGVRELANVMPSPTALQAPQISAGVAPTVAGQGVASSLTPEALAALGSNGLGASALEGLGTEALAGLGGQAASAGLLESLPLFFL